MDNLTNAEKIILILNSSIEHGRASNFEYDGMTEKHKQVLLIRELKETINEKIELFKNIDETSELFKRIMDTAKIALRKLQDDERYNYYSAELILKFAQIEHFFKRRLKPIGLRVIEQSFDTKQANETSNNQQSEIVDENEPLTKNARYITQTITGRKFATKLKKQHEISEALKSFSLNDESQ